MAIILCFIPLPGWSLIAQLNAEVADVVGKLKFVKKNEFFSLKLLNLLKIPEAKDESLCKGFFCPCTMCCIRQKLREKKKIQVKFLN